MVWRFNGLDVAGSAETATVKPHPPVSLPLTHAPPRLQHSYICGGAPRSRREPLARAARLGVSRATGRAFWLGSRSTLTGQSLVARGLGWRGAGRGRIDS